LRLIPDTDNIFSIVSATVPFICRCKIEKTKIVFCPPHAAAESLLAACRYAYEAFSIIECADAAQTNTVREIVMPYLNMIIEEAEKQP
jgi:hypothetical protein